VFTYLVTAQMQSSIVSNPAGGACNRQAAGQHMLAPFCSA